MNFKVNESADKLRGGYYTEPSIAQFLLRWVAEIKPKLILEPGCGDGAFLRQLSTVRDLCESEIIGVESDSAEASKAAAVLRGANRSGKVVPTEFLSWALKGFLAPRVDAVVGNPPFIRYQYLDKRVQDAAEQVFEVLRLPFTRHTNAWVSFVLASLSLLRPGGRLAMVVPAELLHVLHAQSLRTFLGASCSRVLILDPDELWFGEALQGAVLLMAQKKFARSDSGEGIAVIRRKTATLLSESPAKLFETATYANGETSAGKWMRAFLSPGQRAILDEMAELDGVRRFGEVADADVGIVTGANSFFLVTDETVEQFGLQKWAVPMFGRSDHVPGVIYGLREHRANKKLGLPTNFLRFPSDGILPDRVKQYLRLGEEQALHTRFKCRVRSPWYVVPSIYAAPVGMLKRSHDYPRLIHNKMGALTTDTAYRIRVRGSIGTTDLVFSFVNSLTALSAELEGRHYGGGVLELVPSEIERLLIPVVTATAADVQMLDRVMRPRPRAESLLANQDRVVFARAGLPIEYASEINQAWAYLRDRRQRNAASQNGGRHASALDLLGDDSSLPAASAL